MTCDTIEHRFRKEFPGSEDRPLSVFSGHYDTMATNSLDPVEYAPGADDDGSGTTVVLEALRIMSAHQFECTIHFTALAAEEQVTIFIQKQIHFAFRWSQFVVIRKSMTTSPTRHTRPFHQHSL